MAYQQFPSLYGNPYQTMQPIQPQMPQMQQPTLQPIMRFVTSRAEAEVAQIPLDGSPIYFSDSSNGKVYAKALRADGTAPLVVYSLEPEAPPPNFVTQEQFDVVIRKMTELEKAVFSDE